MNWGSFCILILGFASFGLLCFAMGAIAHDEILRGEDPEWEQDEWASVHPIVGEDQ